MTESIQPKKKSQDTKLISEESSESKDQSIPDQLEETNNDSDQKPNISENSDTKELTSILNVALAELKTKRVNLLKEIEELEQRKEKVRKEIEASFAGKSDSIARRVRGFQEYLTGAFQDLAQTTEQLNLIEEPVIVKPSPLDKASEQITSKEVETETAIADTFKPDEALIRNCLKEFEGQPDFHSEPWRLRRSLDPLDLSLLEDWFFNMGGRGAQPSRGSRGKNILVSAGLISILGELYGDLFQTLILASQPERLGEWRRGLQDALGLGREDFGPSSGIVLFERAEGVIDRADRIEERGEVPLILIDAAEQTIDIPVLQFPLWLAFSASQEELYLEEEII